VLADVYARRRNYRSNCRIGDLSALIREARERTRAQAREMALEKCWTDPSPNNEFALNKKARSSCSQQEKPAEILPHRSIHGSRPAAWLHQFFNECAGHVERT